MSCCSCIPVIDRSVLVAWWPAIRANLPKRAADRADLKKDRQVDTAAARAYADSVSALFLEASALTAENVQPLFEAISACRWAWRMRSHMQSWFFS
jgi:hypothetical protein